MENLAGLRSRKLRKCREQPVQKKSVPVSKPKPQTRRNRGSDGVADLVEEVPQVTRRQINGRRKKDVKFREVNEEDSESASTDEFEDDPWPAPEPRVKKVRMHCKFCKRTLNFDDMEEFKVHFKNHMDKEKMKEAKEAKTSRSKLKVVEDLQAVCREPVKIVQDDLVEATVKAEEKQPKVNGNMKKVKEEASCLGLTSADEVESQKLKQEREVEVQVDQKRRTADEEAECLESTAVPPDDSEKVEQDEEHIVTRETENSEVVDGYESAFGIEAEEVKEDKEANEDDTVVREHADTDTRSEHTADVANDPQEQKQQGELKVSEEAPKGEVEEPQCVEPTSIVEVEFEEMKEFEVDVANEEIFDEECIEDMPLLEPEPDVPDYRIDELDFDHYPVLEAEGTVECEPPRLVQNGHIKSRMSLRKKPLKSIGAVKDNKNNYKCDACGVEFKLLQWLKAHQRRHRVVTFPCKVCGKKFPKNILLKLHVLRLHKYDKDKRRQPRKLKTNDDDDSDYEPDQKVYTCDMCDKTFPKKASMDRHRRVHTGEKPYECSTCGKKFSHRESLNIHNRIHNGAKPFECPRCDMRFTSQSGLITHQKRHSGYRPHACPVCKKMFPLKADLRRHQKIHTGEKPFECNICKMKFTLAQTLKSHFLTHDGEKTFECAECGKMFARKGELQSHSVIHTGHKAFECSFCKRAFAHRSSVRDHEKTHLNKERVDCPKCGKNVRSTHLPRHLKMHKNGGGKRFECPECKKMFSSKPAVDAHAVVHTGEKPFECQECFQRFARLSSLYKHQKRHVGDKPYECTECGKKFGQKNTLKQHMVVHSGDKQFGCDVCQKKFSQKSSLTLHAKLHTGDKPYQCNECDKRFVRRIDLERHAVSHSDQKPFECVICDQKFSQQKNLRNHIKRIHNEDRPPKLKKQVRGSKNKGPVSNSEKKRLTRTRWTTRLRKES